MEIFVRLISGQFISLDVNHETSIGAVIFRSWIKRPENQKNVEIKNYAKAVNLI